MIIPAHATEGVVYNIEAKETKVLLYTIPPLKKHDKITVAYYVQFAKSDCMKVIDLKSDDLVKPQLIKQEELTF